MLDDIVFGKRRILAYDEQRHDFTRMLVALRDGCGLEDTGVCDGYRLHFVRVHVETGDQDHVLLAVFDVHEAARVHAADVTGA